MPFRHHEKDILGSEIRLNGYDYRRSTAVRRGVVVGIGDGTNQSSLSTAASDIATELGDYHPQITHLPLQNVSVRRIGSDRCEYSAEYAHTTTSTNADWGLSISPAGNMEYVTGYATEAASGRRWTPNEYPPTYKMLVPVFNVSRTVTLGSSSAINTAINLTYPLINSANVTIAGITFYASRLKMIGSEVAMDTASLASGVRLSYKFQYIGVGMAYPPGDPNGSLVYGQWSRFRYKPITQRPYWDLESIPEGPTYDFSTLAGI
jgi:hypothetical protein